MEKREKEVSNLLVAKKSKQHFLFWELPLKQDTSIALQQTNSELKFTI
jgi:hypothetical protein